MKKNLAKKVTLSILAGALLMSSSVAWAGGVGAVYYGNNGSENLNTSMSVTFGAGGGNVMSDKGTAVGVEAEIGTSAGSSVAVGYDADIGNGANSSVAVGAEAKVSGVNAVAIGAGAKAQNNSSVALGYGSVTTGERVVSVGRADSDTSDDTDDGVYRKIVNVDDGAIKTGSHDAVTGGQLYDNYGGGKETLKNNGSDLIKGKNLTDAVRALDEHVSTISAPDLSGYAKTGDVYTKTEADARYVKISENNVINNSITINENNSTNPVTIGSEGITVGDNSTHMDEEGFYACDNGNHTYNGANAAMMKDGKIKGASGKFEVSTDGSVKAANGTFVVDGSGNVTATNLYNKSEVDSKVTALEAKDLDLQTQINNIGGGASDAIAGINQRLDKTNAKINKVGAGAAALAALHPLEYDPDDKLTFSAGMGNYAGENAAALGAFYRPNEKFMLSLGGTMGNGENMVNLGLSIGLDKPNGYAKLSKRELIQEVNAVKAENAAMKDQLANADERIAKLEALVAQLVNK